MHHRATNAQIVVELKLEDTGVSEDFREGIHDRLTQVHPAIRMVKPDGHPGDGARRNAPVGGGLEHAEDIGHPILPATGPEYQRTHLYPGTDGNAFHVGMDGRPAGVGPGHPGAPPELVLQFLD